MSDPTPLANRINGRSAPELAGFELYQRGAEFLTRLGVPSDAVTRLPDGAIAAIATLVEQNDRYGRRLERIRDRLDAITRERDQLRRIIGADHTPIQNQRLPDLGS
jgi:hypothetical protein